jgi:DNA-binding NarL/FixJ family response regulator
MQPINILITDDHQLFREGMESLLRKLSFIATVFHSGNGREALDVLEKNTIDLVFMDIRMPELSGIEATRLIRLNGNNVKIIAITMMEDPHSVASMFRSGANGYILKNTSFIELQDAIKTVMGGERYYAREISQLMLDSFFTESKPVQRKIENVLLTAREIEIINLICQGFGSKDIGEILYISHRTVDNHRSHIYSKLKISNAADLVYYALQAGIVKGGK